MSSYFQNLFHKSKKKHADDLQFLEKIGRGGFSTVWSCRFQDRVCAAKVISTDLLSATSADLLENEIRIWRSLAHDNLVRLIDVRRRPNECILICELLADTLSERHCRMLRLGTKPRILTILNGLEQIIMGMVYIHNLNLLHRDLKAENILLTSDQETYKIGDFGLVRSVEGHDKTAETGSYRHMAPEVIRHEPYGKTCDIYSFSMLMYEMLTLSLPFPHRTPVDVALGVACRAERPPLPPFPDDVLSILTDCWAQNADTRPSFAELAPRVKTLKLKKTSFGSLQMARLTV